MPPKWTPPVEPRTLEEDAGVYCRDRNSVNYPDHPLQPAVEAIMQMNPAASHEPVDIVACGSSLGNLFRFISGDPKSFRILVESVDDTVHFIRRENSPREIIPNVRGYGHTFPEAYTTWESSVRGSSSHQRILSYNLGGFSCIVRFEGDGYLPEIAQIDRHTQTTIPGRKEAEETVEELFSKLGTESGDSNEPTATLPSQLKLSDAGTMVPQSALFDLKTRSIKRKPDQDAILDAELHRLWLAQIPNFVLAYHSYGKFDDIEKIDARPLLAKWERERESQIEKLIALLERILKITRKSDTGKIEITRAEGDRCLKIREQTHGLPSAFPGEARERWREWLGNVKVDEEDGGIKMDKGGVESSDDSSDTGSLDYTACDAECNYCGHCK